MSETIHNKLVRDLIPNIIENDGRTAIVRTLDDVEYQSELERKLLEEANEVIGAETAKDRAEELADVLEVIKAIAELHGYCLDDIIEICDAKNAKRGGFSKRIFLEKTIG